MIDTADVKIDFKKNMVVENLNLSYRKSNRLLNNSSSNNVSEEEKEPF